MVGLRKLSAIAKALSYCCCASTISSSVAPFAIPFALIAALTASGSESDPASATFATIAPQSKAPLCIEALTALLPSSHFYYS